MNPPDVLLIDALRIVPLPPHHIEIYDVLNVNVPDTITFFEKPISGEYLVEPDGTINLRFGYGKVRVLGLTIEEAKEEIVQQLQKKLKKIKENKDSDVEVILVLSAQSQQISGPHLVRPDGTIDLGTYGSVSIAGMTLEQAKEAIEKHLEDDLESPEIIIDVQDYRSKVYYVVIEQPGSGDIVQKFPIDGNETVLDAVERIGGLSSIANKNHIWIARPAPTGAACTQIIPIDWDAIAHDASIETNYQILPGDRLVIKADRLSHLTAQLGRITAPFERIFGFAIFGNQTVRTLQRGRNQSRF